MKQLIVTFVFIICCAPVVLGDLALPVPPDDNKRGAKGDSQPGIEEPSNQEKQSCAGALALSVAIISFGLLQHRRRKISPPQVP